MAVAHWNVALRLPFWDFKRFSLASWTTKIKSSHGFCQVNIGLKNWLNLVLNTILSIFRLYLGAVLKGSKIEIRG